MMERGRESFLISPTGKGLRLTDSWGSGTYGAPRGSGRRHKGADFVCSPGQEVLAPMDGLVVRLARPYSDDDVLEGLVLRASSLTLKMFYLQVKRSVLGQKVVQGEVLGVAQDVGKRYRGMTPHIHLQIDRIDPTLLMKTLNVH